MKRLEYLSFRFLVLCSRITPFFLLYFWADVFYFVVYYIAGYRKKVVFGNLKSSFPEKSEKEIKQLAKKFYRHLADVTLEAIKGMTISEKQIKKRYVIENADVPNEYFDRGQSVLLITSHYGNWEYGMLGTDMAIKHQTVALYLPLTNPYSEHYGVVRRGRFGMKMVPVQQTKSVFATPPEKPIGVIMAADQSPSNLERAIWLDFLNHDTACIHGPEAYAKKMNLPALYMKISKPRRGHYTLTFEKLVDNPQQYAQGEITKLYFNRLEKDIKECPEYWLWSHRRWKHTREKVANSENK